jgi:hypothetical protein
MHGFMDLSFIDLSADRDRLFICRLGLPAIPGIRTGCEQQQDADRE